VDQASETTVPIESPPLCCALTELRRVRVRRGRPRLATHPQRSDAASPLRGAITCSAERSVADGDTPPLPSATASGADEGRARAECMRRHPSGKGAR
jgi:hypothetical protein